MRRRLKSSIACLPVWLVVAGCASPIVTDAEPEWAGLEQAPESFAVQTIGKDIDLVRALAYGTVIDLGMDITASDGLGGEQYLTARGQEREVQVFLERLRPDLTRIRVAARNAGQLDRPTADRIVEGIASRL